MSGREDVYRITTRENGCLVSVIPMADPFVNHCVRVRGWRNAVRVLFRRYELTVHIDADSDRVERVLELDPDHIGPPGSPSRRAWNAQLAGALNRFANGASRE